MENTYYGWLIVILDSWKVVVINDEESETIIKKIMLWMDM